MTHAVREPLSATFTAGLHRRRGDRPHRAVAVALAGAGGMTAGAAMAALVAAGWDGWPGGGHGLVPLVGAVLALLTAAGAALALNRLRADLHHAQDQRQKTECQLRECETLRAEAETRSREDENRLKWLSEAVKGYALITLDGGGRILTWDRAAEALYGYTDKEAVGRHFSFLSEADDLASGKVDLEIKRAFVMGGHADRGWRVRQGGWKFWAEVVLTPMREEGGRVRGLLCLTRDISAHRQAEDALRSSRMLYRNLTETARDVIITFGKDGAITSLNQAFDRTTGWSRGDWIGQSLLALVHPDDMARMSDLLQCIASGDTTPVVELRIRLAPPHPTLSPGGRGIISETLSPGGRGQGEGEYLAAEWMTTPQLQDGEVHGGLALVRDVTERKKAEESLRATEEKLRQAHKMEAVGRLAGGIAHDFNNLLTVILGNAEMFLMCCEDKQQQFYATEITKAGDRAATLTRQLLAFSHKTVIRPRVLELNERVGNLQQMLRRLIGEDVDFATRTHPEPLHVKADPTQIEQVVMNLVVNARDAMPDGGSLLVQTSAAVLHPVTHGPAAEGEGQPFALLAVTDTGVGMDDHVKSHIFEPFFTTKEQGKGTGLGLAMVYGIVQLSQGHIEVESAPGRGSTFKVYLPLTAEELAPAEPVERRPERLPPATETILLAEDEDGVRALASHALRLSGYHVLECSDGGKALALCDSFTGRIDLLVTDVVMPCLGGVDLARHVTQRWPGTKVLFMSGYPDRDFAVGPETTAPYIQKPFVGQELTARVRMLLDNAMTR